MYSQFKWTAELHASLATSTPTCFFYFDDPRPLSLLQRVERVCMSRMRSWIQRASYKPTMSYSFFDLGVCGDVCSLTR